MPQLSHGGGHERALPEAVVERLRDQVHEELLRPSDPGCDGRAVWSGMISRRLGLIVRYRGVAGVMAAV